MSSSVKCEIMIEIDGNVFKMSRSRAEGIYDKLGKSLGKGIIPWTGSEIAYQDYKVTCSREVEKTEDEAGTLHG